MAFAAFFQDAQFAFDRMPFLFKLQKLKFGSIKPKHIVNFETNSFQVKTIDSTEELFEVLKLRFEVFFREFSTQKIKLAFLPYDVDLYDFQCDHLVVKDKETQKIVACYRLLASQEGQAVPKFYSEGEFELSEVLKLEGNKLELGRACVHKDYRSGTVVSLLWKGLCQYAKISRAKYMFGCSSITRKEFPQLPKILKTLSDRSAFLDHLEIGILADFQVPSSIQFLINNNEQNDSSEKGLNSLLSMYLMAGAKIGSQFAYDREMDCLDLFTLVDFTKLPASFERRFF